MTHSVQHPVLGWDIGGAHVKLALNFGQLIEVRQWPCPLWKGVSELEPIFAEVIQRYHVIDACHRVTMTGELVDCFENRSEGVRAILKAFTDYFDNHTNILVFSKNGFCPANDSTIDYQTIASVNWLSTAQAVARNCSTGVLIDIGSTTTDVIAFANGIPQVCAYDDFGRLKSAELVYTGVVRTGVNHVVQTLQYQQESVPVVAEYFANMGDVYRILDLLPAHADMHPSADGAGKSVEESLVRLARMICLDYHEVDRIHWRGSASDVATTQFHQIRRAIESQIQRCNLSQGVLVGAGCGRFIVRQLADELGWSYVDFAQIPEQQGYQLSTLSADCAPAIALVL